MTMVRDPFKIMNFLDLDFKSGWNSNRVAFTFQVIHRQARKESEGVKYFLQRCQEAFNFWEIVSI